MFDSPLRVADSDVFVADVEDVNFGFRGEHRLHAPADYSLVFGVRRVLRGKNFDLHFRSRDPVSGVSNPGARLGLVIAKKLARRAVHRNFLKRLAREVFRHARQKLPPYDLVLRLSRSPDSKLDIQARRLLRVEVEQLLVRLP